MKPLVFLMSVGLVVGAVGLWVIPEVGAQGEVAAPQQLQLVTLESFCESYTYYTRQYVTVRGNTLSMNPSTLAYRYENVSGTGRYCVDVGLSAIEAVAQSAGCTATQANVYDTSSYSYGYVYITCLGGRDALLEVMADLALAVQTADFDQ
jgi:hypothetical protein